MSPLAISMISRIIHISDITMAFDRIRALGKYLKECESLENFDALRTEQCNSLCQQIRDGAALDFDSGATLLALMQQEPLWKEDHKQSLGTVIQEKVQESTKRFGVTNRTQMQDYQHFPLYLTTREWRMVQQQGVHEVQKCNLMVERCIKLGCKCPSEDTMAMITTMCLLGDPARFNDGLMLRSAYMNMKNCIKTALKAVGNQNEDKGLPFVRVLPPLPGAMNPEIMRAAYDDGDGPAPTLPEGVRMHELMQLKSTIPLRGNRLTLQLQVPKAAPLPFMMPGMPMGNPYMNQFAAQFSNMMAAGVQQAVANAAFQANVPQPSRPLPALEGPPAPEPTVPEVVEVEEKKVEAPKRLLAIENTPSKKPKEEQEKSEEKASLTVNAELEKALETRDKNKKETKERPEAVPKAGKAQPTLKKPAAAPKAGTTMKRPSGKIGKGKGPIPSQESRNRQMPHGCSKCRWVMGCTPSCWVNRGYHR